MNKKLLLTALVVLIVSFCKAGSKKDSVSNFSGKNLVKLNLTALPLNTYSGIYERAIGKKIAVGIGYKLMPKGKLPMLRNLESLIDDDEVNNHLKNLKLGSYAITPEVKFYFGKDVFRGFYIAPFGRYSVYSLDWPYEYDYEENGITHTENILLKGDVKTITGGLLFGAQWKLSKRIYLDWFIIGPNAGSANGTIKGTGDLSDPDKRKALDDAIQDLADSDIPFVKIEGETSSTGATIKFSGPWAGLRGGINLGFRF
ncbi:hypothetical protein Pedsa_2785 [Pseudopedobacter saltans DSM 12145]|uniref:DUF3575 domain-containing protein n=1 Tax=Pseudopedobacter saltans (strain ATCC 51119 / DSM 12145 / JCM 21818 / CCUG 39354 / LMG 10337 / NBRC 100064 / NCIMB 13643) TaxID=762903 RepID=F0S7S1_PSESL|nr:DUF3575 domain-containing protein [Pseudopedobacter saltans]ADY53326.1 hypothetical protein Pedsa_2785 [Pseudopedobacter saltans DSM 12145]